MSNVTLWSLKFCLRCSLHSSVSDPRRRASVSSVYFLILEYSLFNDLYSTLLLNHSNQSVVTLWLQIGHRRTGGSFPTTLIPKFPVKLRWQRHTVMWILRQFQFSYIKQAVIANCNYDTPVFPCLERSQAVHRASQSVHKSAHLLNSKIDMHF